MHPIRNLSKILLLLLAILLIVTGCQSLPGDRTTNSGSGTVSTLERTSGSDSTCCGEKNYPSSVRTLTFVSINDLHGSVLRDEDGKNGLSNTAYLLESMSRYYNDSDSATTVHDDVVLFANGDMFQGTSISNKSYGQVIIDAMNEMEFDAMGLGNHEFDWGLDTVLRYWDRDESNGEADFPLLVSNITQLSESSNLDRLSDADGIVGSVMVEKEGVSVGLIAAIGPCENSISTDCVADYDFTDETAAVQKEALSLKKAGAELVCVSIHYGDTAGISEYDANREIAALRDSDGDYLVDIIFNGHTHSRQSGVISRPGGESVPVVQAGSSNHLVGYVKVRYNVDTDESTVLEYGHKSVDSVGTSFLPEVESIISRYDAIYGSKTALAVSGVTISSKSSLYDYLGRVLIQAFGTDYSMFNEGGVRSTGDITKNQGITEEMLYSILPFDDFIYVASVKGSVLYQIYSDVEGCVKTKSSSAPDWSQLENDSSYYTIAVIDYVYTKNYFSKYRSGAASEVNTLIRMREAMQEDVRLCGESDTLWTPSHSILVSKMSW